MLRAAVASARIPKSAARLLLLSPRGSSVRSLSIAGRAAEWITSNASPHTLKFLESKANESPSDAAAQLLICSALYK